MSNKSFVETKLVLRVSEDRFNEGLQVCYGKFVAFPLNRANLVPRAFPLKNG